MRSLPVTPLMIALVLLSGPLLALASLPPPSSGLALFVLPPWQDRQVFLDAVGARPVGMEQAPLAVLAELSGDDLPTRARANGAWLITDGLAIARLCGAIG